MTYFPHWRRVGALLFGLFAAFFTQAQTTGAVSYYYRSTLPKGIVDGKHTLYFDATRSLFRHEQLPQRDSIVEKGLTFHVFDSDAEGFPIYKDLTRKHSLSKEKAWIGRDKYLIEDTLPTIAWRVFPEKRLLGGYACQRAKGFMGGRMYEVWFTEDIPVSHGPHRLWGLPGLILEAKSEDGAVGFSFVSLRFSPEYAARIAPPQQYTRRFADVKTYITYELKAIREKEKMANAAMEGNGYCRMQPPNPEAMIEKRDYRQ